jgi:hypothetical protein
MATEISTIEDGFALRRSAKEKKKPKFKDE